MNLAISPRRRYTEGNTPLDNTFIHPESYPATEALLKDLGFTPEDLRSKERHAELRNRLVGLALPETAKRLNIGEPTLRDIVENLKKPGHDPRQDFPPPIYKTNVLKIDDLQEGMTLKGVVRNVVDFGIFVDVGLKEDGLVHVSELSERYVRDPHEVAQVGDIVEAAVLKIDKEKSRISLTMKPQRAPGSPEKGPEQGRPQGDRRPSDRAPENRRREQSGPGQPRQGAPASEVKKEGGTYRPPAPKVFRPGRDKRRDEGRPERKPGEAGQGSRPQGDRPGQDRRPPSSGEGQRTERPPFQGDRPRRDDRRDDRPRRDDRRDSRQGGRPEHKVEEKARTSGGMIGYNSLSSLRSVLGMEPSEEQKRAEEDKRRREEALRLKKREEAERAKVAKREADAKAAAAAATPPPAEAAPEKSPEPPTNA